MELGDYAEAARLLEAVQQLAAHFKAFAAIPKVAELSGRLAGLEVKLISVVLRVQVICCVACACSISGRPELQLHLPSLLWSADEWLRFKSTSVSYTGLWCIVGMKSFAQPGWQ